MEYAIEYEGLEEELVKNARESFAFEKVKNSSNKFKLELSDEEFKHFFKIELCGESSSEWIMHKMSVYKLTFVEALVFYITY